MQLAPGNQEHDVGFSILKLFEHHSQTNFPIIKTKHFKVAKDKNHYFIFVIKKWEQRHTLQMHIIYK